MQAGRFALNSGWTPDRILDPLVNGQPILFRVTVREGLTWWQTAEVLENAGLVRAEDFREVKIGELKFNWKLFGIVCGIIVAVCLVSAWILHKKHML